MVVATDGAAPIEGWFRRIRGAAVRNHVGSIVPLIENFVLSSRTTLGALTRTDSMFATLRLTASSKNTIYCEQKIINRSRLCEVRNAGGCRWCGWRETATGEDSSQRSGKTRTWRWWEPSLHDHLCSCEGSSVIFDTWMSKSTRDIGERDCNKSTRL